MGERSEHRSCRSKKFSETLEAWRDRADGARSVPPSASGGVPERGVGVWQLSVPALARQNGARAGFDAVFRYAEADEPVLRACLAAARRRSRPLGLRRFRSVVNPRSRTAMVILDGSGYALDIYCERLRRDLPTIAEATAAKRPPASRRLLALGLVDILARWRLGMYDRYDEDWLPTLKARREPAYLLPHGLYTPNDALADRRAVTMDMLASWHLGEVAPPVLVEEMHTAAELILTALVNQRAKRLSFAQLVDLALQAGCFSPYPGDQATTARYRRGDEPHESEAKAAQVLLSLKDVRKHVRHRGAEGSQGWLDEHFWDAASLLTRLAAQVPE